MPAKVEGTWQMPQGELTLKQDFQVLSGTLTSGDSRVPVLSGGLRGDQISFSAGGARYSGHVTSNGMSGTVTADGATSSWNATRR